MRFKFIFFAVLLSFCPLTQARVLTAGQSLFDPPVYETKALERKFVVVGKVTVQAAQQGDLLSAMQNAAHKYSGDAVLSYHVINYGEVPGVFAQQQTTTQIRSGNTTMTNTQVTPNANGNQQIGIGGFAQPTAEGIIVKFDKLGIETIDETTVIPVLK